MLPWRRVACRCRGRAVAVTAATAAVATTTTRVLLRRNGKTNGGSDSGKTQYPTASNTVIYRTAASTRSSVLSSSTTATAAATATAATHAVTPTLPSASASSSSASTASCLAHTVRLASTRTVTATTTTVAVTHTATTRATTPAATPARSTSAHTPCTHDDGSGHAMTSTTSSDAAAATAQQQQHEDAQLREAAAAAAATRADDDDDVATMMSPTQQQQQQQGPLVNFDEFDFPRMEEEVLQMWRDKDAFRTSLRLSEGRPAFSFYDGPPFATGLPHYGHILAGTMKDVVTRFAHQTGHHVVRRFGWDCHGVPIEFEIDKELGVKSSHDVARIGIPAYNAACEGIVMRYAAEWRKTVERIGRWIDFDNDYKTMDTSYMESVWWVFAQLWAKGLVYRGYKVMPYSTGCTTPLSNFEANMNYKDVTDPAITVAFRCCRDTDDVDNNDNSNNNNNNNNDDDDETYLVAWTTTPWTLVSNLTLCVNPTVTYVVVRDHKTRRRYILAEARLKELYPTSKKDGGGGGKKSAAAAARGGEGGGGGKKAGKKKASDDSNNKDDNDKDNSSSKHVDAAATALPSHEAAAATRSSRDDHNSRKDDNAATAAAAGTGGEAYTIEARMPGSALVGRRYMPLFRCFYAQYRTRAFRVLGDSYVSVDDGTGIVHQAPGFGEDDYRVCLDAGVIDKDERVACPVDENGRFTAEVGAALAGLYVKDADEPIMRDLAQRGVLLRKESIVHSYPYCWRSDTPLLYKAVESWFVRVESLREQLVACNEATYWVPEFVKTRRFSNWLAEARDWNVSRNRYWGTPVPIWHSEDWQEVVCIGSIAELQARSGVDHIANLHRQHVDAMTLPSARAGMPPLRRVPMVFDCWFESGSMPYAQVHYPFEHADDFHTRFPADFIAEGLDQTRGWFYTLLVLGVALFGTAPYRNVAVNGLVLAEDGKKMSKRLKNYPEPSLILDRYGADALRMYIISSPVVRGEPLRFREAGVRAVVKDILLPLFHATRFFIDNCNHCIAAGGCVGVHVRSRNEMDRWIRASVRALVREVRAEMSCYHLYNVVPRILRFIVDLSNWYVRMNRRRMKSRVDGDDRACALSTTLVVLFAVARVVAPMAPFVAEMLYQRIKPLLPASEQVDSVHYLMLPDVDDTSNSNNVTGDNNNTTGDNNNNSNDDDDADLVRAMSRMITVVELVRVLRDRLSIPLKRPVREVVVVHPDATYRGDVQRVADYVAAETNAFAVTLVERSPHVSTHLDVNFEVLGRRLRTELPAIRKALQALSGDDADAFVRARGGDVAGVALSLDEVRVLRRFADATGSGVYESNTDNDVVVLLDTRDDVALTDAWRAREFVNRVQQLRKKAKLRVTDRVHVYYALDDDDVAQSLQRAAAQLDATLHAGTWRSMSALPHDAVRIAEEDNTVSGAALHLVLVEAPAS